MCANSGYCSRLLTFEFADVSSQRVFATLIRLMPDELHVRLLIYCYYHGKVVSDLHAVIGWQRQLNWFEKVQLELCLLKQVTACWH